MIIETNLQLILADTIGGVVKNLPYFLLIIWGFKIMSREISKGVKQMPIWINQFFIEMRKAQTLERALDRK